MKVLDIGQIQMDIGEKVNYMGRIYTVVSDDRKSLCCKKCPFRDRKKCSIFACSPLSRDDGKSVLFDELKS